MSDDLTTSGSLRNPGAPKEVTPPPAPEPAAETATTETTTETKTEETT